MSYTKYNWNNLTWEKGQQHFQNQLNNLENGVEEAIEGGSYSEGYGIDIAQNVISVDTEVVAEKSDLTNLVTTNTQQDITAGKSFKCTDPEVSTPDSAHITYYGVEVSDYNANSGTTVRNNGFTAHNYSAQTGDIIESSYRVGKIKSSDEDTNFELALPKKNGTVATTDDVATKSKVTTSTTGTSTNEIGYITVDNIEYKLPSGGGLTVDTIWTNPDATPATFGEQDITISNFTDYSLIVIEYAFGAGSHLEYRSTMTFKRLTSSNSHYLQFVAYQGFLFRTFKMSDTGIHFYNASKLSIGGSSWSTQLGNQCIPLKIYGIK